MKENYACCEEKPQKAEMEKIQPDECGNIMNSCSHDVYLQTAKDGDEEVNNRPSKLEKDSLPLLKIVSSPPIQFLNNSLNMHNEHSYLDGGNGLEENLIMKKNHSSSFTENVKKRHEKHSELVSHKSGKNLDFDETNFKELLNTKANVARTITYHDKHRKKHKIKQKKLEGTT